MALELEPLLTPPAVFIWGHLYVSVINGPLESKRDLLFTHRSFVLSSFPLNQPRIGLLEELCE